jgi:hypothetical protein
MWLDYGAALCQPDAFDRALGARIRELSNVKVRHWRAIVMRNDRVISINNTTQIDLQGQAASESHGHRHISGTGGQLQFVRGAYASLDGQSFICLALDLRGAGRAAQPDRAQLDARQRGDDAARRPRAPSHPARRIVLMRPATGHQHGRNAPR